MEDHRLSGFTVGITADRRWEEQAELLRRRGACVLHGPSIRTLPLGPEMELREVSEQIILDPPDIVIANTGIGMRGGSQPQTAGVSAKRSRAHSTARHCMRVD